MPNSGDDLIKAVITAVLILVLIPIGIFIYDSIYETVPDTRFNVTNETFNTSVVGTWVQLDHRNIVAGSTVVWNASNVVCTENTDYVMNNTDGRINGSDTITLYNNTTAYIRYLYEDKPTMAQNTLDPVNNAYQILIVMVIIVAAAAIMKILIGAFGKGGIGV